MDPDTLHYSHDGLTLTGQLFRPAGSPRAAVAVFPTIANPTPAVEAKARVLRDAGFASLIADFYGEQPADMDAAFALAQPLRGDAEAFRSRIRPALAALAAEVPDVPMAAIGFCLGGHAVLELARDGADLVLAASFHGLLQTHAPARPGAVKARLLVCHGDADPMVPRAHVMAFWEEMDRAGADWHFQSYAGVLHGFTNPNAPAGSDNVGYDASADRQSWAALMSLLEELVGPKN